MTATATAPLPPVIRSRLALMGAPDAPSLPITPEGSTFTMAQEMEWLDATHFAVGRWDGSLSLFSWNESATAGPLITTAASDPASEGVQMIVLLGEHSFVTSSGESSLGLWTAANDAWRGLSFADFAYDASLGAANSGAYLPASETLVVGHANGFLSSWHVSDGSLSLLKTLDVRNPSPVNPWGLHNIRGVQPYGGQVVVTGSEDGFISVVSVAEMTVVQQVVYNPSAQRGINSVALDEAGNLLVANCAVGSADHNLWYFALDPNLLPRFVDAVNLAVDSGAAQVFNFCTIWAKSAQGPCFFSSTEEGALWMGSVEGGKLVITGYEPVTSPLGSALGYQAGGQLALVSYDLYEFGTGA